MEEIDPGTGGGNRREAVNKGSKERSKVKVKKVKIKRTEGHKDETERAGEHRSG